MLNQVLSDVPRVMLLKKFLSDEEVDHLLLMAEPLYKEAGVIDNDTGVTVTGDYRTGFVAEFLPSATLTFKGIEDRIASVTGTRKVQGEPIQVIKYDVGHGYKPHHDFFHDNSPGHVKHKNQGGQRIHTCVIYLKAAEEGGETEFPELKIKVKPEVGDALIWTNIDPDGKGDPRTLHIGCPVVKGQKIIASRWIRERAWDGSEENEALKAKAIAAADLVSAKKAEENAKAEYQEKMNKLRATREEACYKDIQVILDKYGCRLVGVPEPEIDNGGVLRIGVGIHVRAQ